MLNIFADNVNRVRASSLTYHLHMPAYDCCLELQSKDSWKSADVESDLRNFPSRSSVTIAVLTEKWRHWKKKQSARRSKLRADRGSELMARRWLLSDQSDKILRGRKGEPRHAGRPGAGESPRLIGSRWRILCLGSPVLSILPPPGLCSPRPDWHVFKYA